MNFLLLLSCWCPTRGPVNSGSASGEPCGHLYRQQNRWRTCPEFKQPEVLGELVAGLVVGVSGLGLVNPEQPVLVLLSQVGVILLLFEVGLNLTSEPFKVGPQACSRLGRDAFALRLQG